MSDKAIAIRESSEIVEGQWEETAPVLALPSVPELIARFLASHDVRASSRATYERTLRAFSSWLEQGGRRLIDMRREDILAYRDSLKSQGIF